MTRLLKLVSLTCALLLCLGHLRAHAAERVTLKSGFTFDCTHRVATGATVRLFFAGTPGMTVDANYLDIPAASILSVETIPDLPVTAPPLPAAAAATITESLNPTLAELHEMLTRSGAAHNIDVDLLASVVHAESGGRTQAVSRVGARGLMQLMPQTALALGVPDVLIPSQNVEGGTRYLDQMLTRYHNNIALALAAYNAGPGAVDRYHGIPPFRETRAYVSRILREFNRRKSILVASK